MKKEAKRVSRIIDELSTHFLAENPSKMNVTVDNLFDRFKITFEVSDVEYSDLEVQAMHKVLNEPRLPAVEAYYWSLSSESPDDSEIGLIGMMIDKAEITFSNSTLNVYIHRYK